MGGVSDLFKLTNCYKIKEQRSFVNKEIHENSLTNRFNPSLVDFQGLTLIVSCR